jgi:hypothetical protein
MELRGLESVDKNILDRTSAQIFPLVPASASALLLVAAEFQATTNLCKLISRWLSTLYRIMKMALSSAEFNLDANKPSSLHTVALDKTHHPSGRA